MGKYGFYIVGRKSVIIARSGGEWAADYNSFFYKGLWTFISPIFFIAAARLVMKLREVKVFEKSFFSANDKWIYFLLFSITFFSVKIIYQLVTEMTPFFSEAVKFVWKSIFGK